MSSSVTKMRRVQELFDIGRPLQVSNGDLLWVVKPTTFIRDEAIRDARSARARALLAWDSNSDERASAKADVAELDVHEMAEVLARGEEFEHQRRAADDIRTEKDWAERLEALRSVELEGASEEEVAAVAKANQEFSEELVRRTQEYYEEEYNSLVSEGLDELASKLMKRQRDRAGAAAFAEARKVTEIWRCLRNCSGVFVDGRLDHSACGGHREQFVDKRAEVYMIPDPLIASAADALADLQMTEAEAGNSVAPSVSSEPSEPRSTQEDSTPSTQTAM